MLCKLVKGRETGLYAPGIDPKIPYSQTLMCEQPELGLRIAQFHTYGES
jgi:hypothetical protein